MTNLEILCKENRTGETVKDKELLDTIADSDLKLYEIKMRLNICSQCNSYVSYNGNSYCFGRTKK
jgi:hypothetical protein